jgi:hypothetical protein
MRLSGILRKMGTEQADPVRYSMPIGDGFIDLNPLLGQKLSLRFTGNIFCLACKRRTPTSFGQGHCFSCFQSLASLDNCILRPHTCHHHHGTCRQPDWGTEHCFIPHIVYLANSSGLKVGITRAHQAPTRWMDQGAVEAIPIARTRSRLDCGIIEIALSEHLPDRTNWRKMLSGVENPVDLRAERERVFGLWGKFPGEKAADAEPLRFRYPVLQYPAKVASLNAEKEPRVTGTLWGVKGQYLIFDTGVLNVRKYGGYEAEVETS